MKLILKNHNGKYAVSKRKAPNSRKWCSTWENSISFAFGHFVKLLYNQSQRCHLILIALLFLFRGLGWFTRVCLHLHGCHILDLQRHWTVSIYHRKKYDRVFFHLDVGIELNCEPITRNYQRIGSDLVVENLAVAGCLGAAWDCWVGIVVTSNSQNWGLEGGRVPTLTLAALFPAAGSLTWTREENHLVRRRGWQDKIR